MFPLNSSYSHSLQSSASQAITFLAALSIMLLGSCTDIDNLPEETLFTTIDPQAAGIDFRNDLTRRSLMRILTVIFIMEAV